MVTKGVGDSIETNDPRIVAVRAAVAAWVNQLIPLSGRNQLLYYRTLKRGTLDLVDAEPQTRAELLAGKTVRLSRLFPSTDEQLDRDAEANKTATTIHKKAVEAFEERGIGVLFVAYGMATWTSSTSSATPAAPVLLCPLDLEPRGAAEADFDLTLEGDWDINDTFLHLLATEFKVQVDEQPFIDLLEPAVGTTPPLDRVLEEFANRVGGVPGFSISPRVVVGTFAYTKLPMVKDLQDHVESLAAHDLISAIAGVEAAQDALRELRATDLDPRLPDLVTLSDEHLILDADASQNYAINAALTGEPLIIQGPPGTGKSQTIANLITSLTARGKRVLFVAEKRAAIDAVTKRLRQAGLGDLVLDLHGGVTSKKQLAAELGQTLADMSRIAQVDHSELHRHLSAARMALDDHVQAMHERRQPWDLSVFEMNQELIRLGDRYHSDVRFVGSRLLDLNASVASRVRDELNEWAGLTGPINTGASPWSGARVQSDNEARQALDLVSDLSADIVPQVSATLDEVLNLTGLRLPASVDDWTELLGLLKAVESTLQTVRPEIYELDLSLLVIALKPASRSPLSRVMGQLFSSEYRAAKTAIRATTVAAKMSAIDLGRTAEEARRQTEEWSRLGGVGVPLLPDRLDAIALGFDRLTSQLASLAAFLVTRDLRQQPHRTVKEETDRLLSDQQTLFRLPRIHQLEESLLAAHVGPLLEAVRSGVPGEAIVQRFDHCWLSSIRTAVMSSDPRLANFDATLHDQKVEGFREDDRKHLEITAVRVRRAVAERALAVRNQHTTQETLVKAQSQRKRGHLPLRRLFEQAPDVLTALRPCWVMSPLVVAQTMPARAVFDVVIFDEASQVLPADAISALLRAPQAIVAGDQHQLPPTTFFEGGGVEETNDDDGSGLTSGFESVLDVLNALLRNYMLTWHYRSEDERLIAFSNHSIYHGGLTTFPGSVGQERLSHQLVPHRVESSADTRSNGDEVVRVVDLMIDHARNRPDETLGVIAMGVHHADRIEEMLRRRIADERSPDLDRFFDESNEERAFVKNIERVQGDERDAIILTIGYSKQPDGRLFYRFGPLMTDGGERRLNVAVTRARKRVTVVSSFSHTDMDPSRSAARGVELLRQYLKYAESGGTQLDGVRTDISLNPFEIDVLTRLEAAGLKLIPQYGQSGFRIDFAVCHPDRPGEMVLAIEADGASYHSAVTVRDRDRLRQQVLEKLGWKFCRIWSTDWFNDPRAGVAKVLAAYNTALVERERGPYRPRHVAPTMSMPIEPPPEKPGRSLPRPRIRPGLKIDEYSHTALVALARWIKSDTLLRTEEQILQKMMDELGFSRRGTKIVGALRWAMNEA